jgi:hypothetical protein
MWLVLFWLVMAIIVRIVLRTVPMIPFNWRILLWFLFVLFIFFAFAAIGRIGIGGFELVSTYPNTCKPTQERDGLICYEKCRPGYHGVGPVCWANSVNIGAGKLAGLGKCPVGWSDDGLICREPIRCASGLAFFTKGCSGGKLRAKELVCPGPMSQDAKEKVAGLCYNPCPKHLPARIAGMPYLCYAGGSLSYGRGAGSVPSLMRLFGRYPIL